MAKTTDIVELGLIAGLLYVGYKILSSLGGFAKSALSAPAEIGQSQTVQSMLDSILGPPGGYTGTTAQLFHTVLFPDGDKHAVDASTVDANNQFWYVYDQNNTLFQLGKDASGQYVASYA
jgi:hypothetical protein